MFTPHGIRKLLAQHRRKYVPVFGVKKNSTDIRVETEHEMRKMNMKRSEYLFDYEKFYRVKK